MEFSEKLKILRTQANLTQNELADKLYISRQAVSNYEQGRGYPSMDTLVLMCKLFNTSLDELLSSGVKKQFMRQVVITVSIMFVSLILSIACVYLATIKDLSSILYLCSGIGIHIIPFMCLLVYLLFQYNPPKKANKFLGYRTKRAMSNQLMWDYAQAHFSILYARVASVLLCLNIVYSAISLFVDFIICLILFCSVLCIQAVSLLIPIFFVENNLKKFVK